MIKHIVTGLAAAAVFTTAAAQELKEINFGIISTESTQNLFLDLGLLAALAWLVELAVFTLAGR